MRRSTIMLSCIFFFIAFALISVSYAEDNSCVSCHEKLTPGQVKDWKISKHRKGKRDRHIIRGQPEEITIVEGKG